jgi:hypothetical protein
LEPRSLSPVFDDLTRMHTSDGNAAVELHDSQVEGVDWQGEDCTVVLTAYVHRSKGKPGIDAGSGWSQIAHVRVTHARLDEAFPILPLRLAGGRLLAQELELTNVIPVPSQFPGPVRLQLLGEGGESMVLVGDAAELVLVGDASYVDDFSG